MNYILSILMPCYNKEKYLEKALNSILMQKTVYNYKIVILDDCSTDSSYKIAEEYVKKYPNVIELSKNEKNMGALASSLKLYKNIDTKYFTVLDPDDYWIGEDKIQKAVTYFEKNSDCSLYSSNFYIKNENDNEQTLGFNTRTQDFDFYTLGFCHTSGTFFRTSKNINWDEIDKYIGTDEEKAFEGDTFRNLVHLLEGYGHFSQEVESVYNMTGDGIWSKYSQFAQVLENFKGYFAYAKYFPEKYKNHLLGKASCYLKTLSSLFDFEIANSEFQHFIQKLKEFNIFVKANNIGLLSNLCFYLPSKTVGGYEYAFIRYAKYFSEKLNYEVYYVDYEDGVLHKNLKDTKCHFIKYEDNCNKIDIDCLMKVITPITLAGQLPSFNGSEGSRVVFWDAHPLSLEWLQYRTGLRSQDFVIFVNKIYNDSTLFFMDKACKEPVEKYLNKNFDTKYVSTIVEENFVYTSNKLKNKEEINIGWLGRLDSDKIYSLLNLLKNFNDYKTEKNKIIHIIGDGGSKSSIRKEDYPNLSIEMTSTLVNKELEDYMINNIDVLFAMGTSLLEGASRKIPSVMCFLDTQEFIENSFTRSYDLEGGLLGTYISNKDSVKYETIDSILDDIYIYSSKEIVGQKSYEHYKKYHSIEFNAISLLYHLMNSNGMYKTYERLELKNLVSEKDKFIQQIFSIRNSKDKSHKIIRILGFKFAVRKKVKNIKELEKEKMQNVVVDKAEILVAAERERE